MADEWADLALFDLRAVLQSLGRVKDNPAVEGYAAGEEIEEAIPHLEAAVADVEEGRDDE